jgi:hypothetical protein
LFAAGVIVLLLSLFAIQRSPAILVLAMAYLFSAFMAVPCAASFPGVIAPFGVNRCRAADDRLDRRGSTHRLPAVPADLRHAAGGREGAAWQARSGVDRGRHRSGRGDGRWHHLLIFEYQDMLPRFMEDSGRTTDVWLYVPGVALVWYALLVVLLGPFGRSVLGLWLTVVICALAIDLVLLSFISSGPRLIVGWWAGRLYSLTVATVVLLVRLAEAASMAARLPGALRPNVAGRRRGW